MTGRIVVAMSGGVDSSVAAAVLVEAGYDVVGITLRLSGHQPRSNVGGCCGSRDAQDAAEVAEVLGIPHFVIDASTAFNRDVVGSFHATYRAGKTPVPCITCNETVKFRDLVSAARHIDAVALATGHYGNIRWENSKPALFRGLDAARDQTYFLHSMTREQLAYIRFPIGHLLKSEVRAIAHRHNLSVMYKPESQDLCFVAGGDYRLLIDNGEHEKGEVVDGAGSVVGEHTGVSHFTVGQRRGLNVSGRQEPVYVVAIDPEKRRVTVGPRSALAVESLRIERLNWIGQTEARVGQSVQARVRSKAPPVSARVVPEADGAQIIFDSPEYAVAPGQACVLYDGNRVLGGGIIASTTSAFSQRCQPAL